MAGKVPVQTGDTASPSPAHPIVLVLDNLRSAYNVGNIFRLAEVCRINKIVTCGYTAAPPHPKLKKTARGCDERVPCGQYETSLEAVHALKQSNFQIVAVETVAGAADIWDVEFHRQQSDRRFVQSMRANFPLRGPPLISCIQSGCQRKNGKV